MHNGDFFGGKHAVTERIFDIALFEGTMSFNRKADQKLKRVQTENWSKKVGFAPNPVFVIAKDNGPRFFLKRKKVLILFGG